MTNEQNNTKKVKEMQFKPNISEHDLQTKVNKIDKMLKKGNQVKVFVFFPGRSIVHPELGDEIFDRVLKIVKNGKLVNRCPLKGQSMMMFLTPN